MKFPLIHKSHKKVYNTKKVAHKRLLLTDPNSLIGYRIDGGRIKLMSVLGVGGNGVVYLAVECRPNGQSQLAQPRQFAVKALSKAGLEPCQVRVLEREFDVHAHVSGHPNIVTFHGLIEENDFFFVLLDYVPGGDIFDMMELHRVYLGNDDLIRSVFLQLIDAVEHIHNLGVYHRDIKPENILCKDAGSRILLADFGLGTHCKAVKDYGLGSEPYMAPQCFGGFWKKLGPYSTPHADIWALGVVLVNLACARNPWHKATEESPIYRKFLSDPDHLLETLPISLELNDVLKCMFAINPHARISLTDLRSKVQVIKRFALTEHELKFASTTIRYAAKNGSRAPRQPKLTPGAPHAAVARQITNLTEEDIGRLETEAREEARETSVSQDQESHRSLFADADIADDEEVGSIPLLTSPPAFSPTFACDVLRTPSFAVLLSPGPPTNPTLAPSPLSSSSILSPSSSPPLSPTLTLVDSTPRPNNRITLVNDSEPIFTLGDEESDTNSESGSDVDSIGPITPQSRPVPDDDLEIAVVPEVILGGSCLPDEEIAPLSAKQNSYPVAKFPQDVPSGVSGRVRLAWWL